MATEIEKAADSMETPPNLHDIHHTDVDALAWWRRHAHLYPRLARIARRILAIPCSEATSERVFSRMGNMINPRRNRLKPRTVHDTVRLINSMNQ